MNAYFKPYKLAFKNRILTSRGGMNHKYGYFVFITDGYKTGIGECSIIKGLSRDDLSTIESTLETTCHQINDWEEIKEKVFGTHPAISFAIESALLDFKNGGERVLFQSDFTHKLSPIAINGLVWMGDEMHMNKEIDEKYQQGYRCIKLKVGAIDFEAECRLLEKIRTKYNQEKIEIRVDANGAFTPQNVRKKLSRLSLYQLHSIEQPIAPAQWELMRDLCSENTIPIALDEELIPLLSIEEKQRMLSFIQPQYIILKPSLIGGFSYADEWIKLAEDLNIKWWATSALESNIGLNAIAQWVYTKGVDSTQGLGTGGLYEKNISSPLAIKNASLYYDFSQKWGAVEDVCN